MSGDMIEPQSRVELPRENIYGHYARLVWLRDQLRPSDHAVELGCGTGYMITLPLRCWGYDVVGVDIDQQSISYGRKIMRQAGMSEDALECVDLADYSREITVVIASEVFEHMTDDVLDRAFAVVRARLPLDGRLLVTVPNGYSWFELESALWFRLRIGRLIEFLRLDAIVNLIKRMFIGEYRDAAYLSTVADSPHVQRFTLSGIRRRLEGAGFEVIDAGGSALICGPFSNLLFTGLRRVMAVNLALGRRWPALASDFQLVAAPRR
jgi:hypothetical protein